MTPPIRLLIVDDHPVVRDGLRGLFSGDPEFEVVGEAGDGHQALAALAAGTTVDVVLLDLRMPHMGGVDTIRRMRRDHPQVRILVLTTYDTDQDVVAAVEAGATGYLLKDAPRDDLLRAVRSTHAGDAVLAPRVASRLMGRVGAQPAAALSARELQVLRLVAGGGTNREIARALRLSEATVKTHLIHLYQKLGVRDRAAAVAEAYRRQLLP